MSFQSQRFDWEQIRKKLQQSQIGAETTLHDQKRREAVYRERAARFALKPVTPDTSARSRALMFTLGTERYALELQDLAEVCPFNMSTPVPGAPEELIGVINLRGEIRPVVDLARVLGVPDVEDRTGGWILLLQRGDRTLGLRVDQVENIRQLRPDELADPALSCTHVAARYSKAITPDTVVLLNAEKLLSLPFIKEGSL